MADTTKIEWADATFNPWWGCEKISPGCAHCYADTLSKRFVTFDPLWGAGHGFRFFGDKHWQEPLKWARTMPAKLRRRPRVFCASMADVFEERDELAEHRLRLFELIEATPELDWLILTKRPEKAREFLFMWDAVARGPLTVRDNEHHGWGCSPNVWMGVSIENARYTWRADVLREIPAAVRFISAEPLLGSLYDGSSDDDSVRVPVLQADGVRDAGLGGDGRVPDAYGGRRRAGVALSPDGASPGSDQTAQEVPRGDARHSRAPLDLSGIDWVIVGGESGPKARPFHLDHAREIVRAARARCPEWGCPPDACDDSTHNRPAVFVKQLGANPVGNLRDFALAGLRDRKGGDWDEWPADLRIREFPRSAA